MEKKFRSSCLIASTLDLIGDKWSLLIVRDMLMYQKKTFKDLTNSDEGIATNLLSTRLKMLESIGVITKRKLPENKKMNIYLLTDKGLDLAPIIMEVVIWSDRYVREYNPNMNDYEAPIDKDIIIKQTQEAYRKFAQGILK